MKKIFPLLVIIGCCLSLVSCSLETSDNGDLDGFWQLRTMTEAGGTVARDMRTSGITWSFQGKLLELRDNKDVSRDIVMSFRKDGDTLVLSSPYIVDRDQGDIAVTDTADLLPYGISRLSEAYEILTLTGSAMILKSAEYTLEFRKY